MKTLRHFVGRCTLVVASTSSELNHWLIHVAAWLMDHDDINNDCVTCIERRKG